MSAGMMIFDLFCGAGGASLGIHAAMPEAQIVGIDNDRDACATHVAAGYTGTLRADITTLVPTDYGPADGLWASPPCPAFSSAGERAGVAQLDDVIRHVMTWQPHDGIGWDGDPLIWLVTEPLRWVTALVPEWVVCEQVPAVLPIWEATALRLRELGYWAWAGVLNSADYGVPQTRERAMLLASCMYPIEPPVPTHAKHPRWRLDGTEELPWVSMAEALGLDNEDNLQTNRGQDADGNRQEVAVTRPAPTVSTKASGQWTHSRQQVTLEELATLQGFPAGYPFQGNKTSIARQIGNAVPPPLARACVQAVTGLQRGMEAAAS